MNESNPSDQELAELLTLTAEVTTRGTIRYRNHLGQLHRVLGPAVVWADGTKGWFQSDMRHRTDGPAMEYTSGTKQWYQYDKRHRADGPAVIWADSYQEWYLNGVRVSEEDFNEQIKTTH